MEWNLIFNNKLWPIAQDILVAVAILSFFCYLVDGFINHFKKGR